MVTKSTKGRARKAKARDEGNGIAGNPQVSPAGSSGSPKRDPAEVTGPHVSLATYFRGHRHWSAPLPDGTPRPLDRQFLELEREGIACLYDALNALVEESYPHGHDMRRPTTAPNLGRWGDMHRERAEVKRAWAANNGTLIHHVGPRPANEPAPYVAPYGESYTRARHQLIHDVSVEHVVTEEEAARENAEQLEEAPQWRAIIRPGDVYNKIDPQQSERATAEQVGHRWAEVYAEEVRHLLGDEPNHETLNAFAHLHVNLKGYAFGSREGARVMQRMKPKDEMAKGETVDSLGAEVLNAFGRIREHLNALLDEVAKEHKPEQLTSAESSPTEQRTMQRINWEGSTIEFITVMKMLVRCKYVELPSTGGKQGEGNVSEFIRRFQQTFIVRKDDDTEFTTEGLADRWRGRPMGVDRERQFDIPEAMPSNETMEEDRQQQFDIPEATRKRPRT